MLALIAVLLAASPDPGPQRAVDLSWLEGHWVSCDTGSPGLTAETWIAAGEVLLGTNVNTAHDGTVAGWEQLRIVHSDSVTSYVAMPGGGPPVTFVLVDQAPEGAVFENREHDWPQVVVYERDGDRLTADVRGLDPDQPRLTWTFTRAEPGAGCPG